MTLVRNAPRSDRSCSRPGSPGGPREEKSNPAPTRRRRRFERHVERSGRAHACVTTFAQHHPRVFDAASTEEVEERDEPNRHGREPESSRDEPDRVHPRPTLPSSAAPRGARVNERARRRPRADIMPSTQSQKQNPTSLEKPTPLKTCPFYSFLPALTSAAAVGLGGGAGSWSMSPRDGVAGSGASSGSCSSPAASIRGCPGGSLRRRNNPIARDPIVCARKQGDQSAFQVFPPGSFPPVHASCNTTGSSIYIGKNSLWMSHSRLHLKGRLAAHAWQARHARRS